VGRLSPNTRSAVDACNLWHHHDVATIAERILEAIRFRALDDDQLAKRLGVSQRQSINQTARALEAQGVLRRYVGPDGKIVNALPETSAPVRWSRRPVPGQFRHPHTKPRAVCPRQSQKTR
jgi:hypothetical protein